MVINDQKNQQIDEIGEHSAQYTSAITFCNRKVNTSALLLDMFE